MASNMNISADQLQCLQDGFDALRIEYHRLWTRCQVLENNVESAKAQVRFLFSSLSRRFHAWHFMMNNLSSRPAAVFSGDRH